METADKAIKRQDPTYFVSKLRYLQMPGPQSRSVCQPVLAPSRLQILAENLFNPIDITLGCNFKESFVARYIVYPTTQHRQFQIVSST